MSHTDMSSDKSTDSGTILDLSKALSESEETWLFAMEAKMKGKYYYSNLATTGRHTPLLMSLY